MDLKSSVPKELQDRVLQVVEKAAKDRKVRVGVNEVTKMIERGQAKFVVLFHRCGVKNLLLLLVSGLNIQAFAIFIGLVMLRIFYAKVRLH